MDGDNLEALRRWGRALRRAGDEQGAAAGRAILMLIDEIEQLRLELSHAQRPPATPATSDDVVAEPELAEPEELEQPEVSEESEEPAPTFHERLQRMVRESSEEADATTASPQSWIESLRRQK